MSDKVVEIIEHIGYTDQEMNDMYERDKNYSEPKPWSFSMQSEILRITLRNLLNTAELNQDDMEVKTRLQITRAHQILDHVYRSNQVAR